MKALTFLGLYGSVLLLAGCGGSSGSGGVSNPTVKFTISWGARSRDCAAPSSALSAVVTLTGASPTGGNLSVEEDRRVDPAAYIQNYVSNLPAKPGTYPLTINFYSQGGGAGDIVATGSASVTILSDGSGIGTVSITNKVTQVTVVPSQIVFAPQTKSLSFTARDSLGNLVAVSAGSASWTQVDGLDVFAMTGDGQATGLKRGLSKVRVTVDGVTSDPVTVEGAANPTGPAIVLNFDDIPAMSTQVSGTAIPVDNRLSTRYLSTHGISFASLAPYVGVCHMPDGTAVSNPNSIVGSSADGHILYGKDTPVTFTFSDPLNPATPGVTQSFSLAGDKDGRADNTVEIDAYDVNGNLIGKKTAADAGGEVLTITFSTPKIHRVVFLGAPGTNDGVALDNVTFSPVVPAS